MPDRTMPSRTMNFRTTIFRIMHAPPARPGRPSRRALGIAAPVLALGLALAACGDGDAAPEASATQTAANGDVYNDADVAFATDMIPHHAQALVMADLTVGRQLDRPVQQLVDDIRATQGPEIQTMSGWLTDWDEEVPETMRDHSNAGHGSGGTAGADEGEHSDEMPGMMSSDDMSELEQASDADFERLWLEMMVEHHEGAVEMARTEQEEGEFADAVELAETIETAQEQEIETMRELLG